LRAVPRHLALLLPLDLRRHRRDVVAAVELATADERLEVGGAPRRETLLHQPLLLGRLLLAQLRRLGQPVVVPLVGGAALAAVVARVGRLPALRVLPHPPRPLLLLERLEAAVLEELEVDIVRAGLQVGREAEDVRWWGRWWRRRRWRRWRW
jgi:hypothetical protein